MANLAQRNFAQHRSLDAAHLRELADQCRRIASTCVDPYTASRMRSRADTLLARALNTERAADGVAAASRNLE